MSPVKKPVRPEGGQNRSPLEDRRVRLALAVLLVHQLLTERFDHVAQHSFQCPHCGSDDLGVG